MVGGISDIRVAPYPVKTLPANALPVFTLYCRASVYCARSRRWTLALNYNVGGLDPGEEPRTPDIIVTPDEGITYSGSTTMIGDHGGFAHDDTNVVMLAANPHFFAADRVRGGDDSASCADHRAGPRLGTDGARCGENGRHAGTA
jgi:hypothetical protein